VTSEIGLVFLPRGSILAVITFQELPLLLPSYGRSSRAVPWYGGSWSRWTIIIFVPFRGPCFWRLLFRFGRCRPLHNAQSLTVTRWKFRLLASRPPARESAWRSCWMSSRFLDVAANSGFGPLFHCCIWGLSFVSSRPSVFYECASYAVPFLYGGHPSAGAATSCGTHHHPGSVSSAVAGALRLDASPQIGPPVLK
jgi:hypothetical protein